ncbi:variable surface protein [Plasmodium gonderi]|uniref:Variable surface protein n=1 Tax=Plasmodium gonderi TaxID=77519 RepID=A0A1Y1JPC4_PLAGO|nr:variable surface protein [Plasmodium gonderi]GAW84100.1 variable surface protein [Plasmodium gonderi]
MYYILILNSSIFQVLYKLIVRRIFDDFCVNNTIYGFVKYFDQCKKIMDDKVNHIDASFTSQCSIINEADFSGYLQNPKKLCTQAMPYLFEIYYYNNIPLNGAGCLYLYYWLYNKNFKQKTNSSVVKTFYEKLIDIYNTNYAKNGTQEIYKKDINDDDIEKLSVIYNVFSFLNNMNDKNQNQSAKDFCYAVETIKNKYNLIIQEKGSETSKQQIVEYCQSNIKLSILITILVLLVPSLLIFIVYKFTPYGSYILRAIKWKKRVLNNRDNKWNIMQSSEIFNDMPRNMQYKMSYNSD